MDRITPNIAKMTAKRIAKRKNAIISLTRIFKPSVAVLKFSKKISNGLKIFDGFMIIGVLLLNELSRKRKNVNNSQWAKEEGII